MAQLDLFGAAKPARRSAEPDPAEVRRRIEKALGQLRDAQTMPWSEEELLFHSTVIPQMTNWLEPDEAAQIKTELNAHLERLSA